MPFGGEHNWHTSSGLRDPGSTRSGHRDVPFINTQNLQSVFLYPGVYIVTDKLMRKIFWLGVTSIGRTLRPPGVAVP